MLGPTISDLLPSAVGVALSPLPIVAVILMLTTPKARSNGPAFVAGWVVGLVVVSVAVVLLAGGADSSDSSASNAVNLVKVLLGLLLVALAKKNWDKRPQPGEEPQLPKWMDALATFDAGRSFLTGAALSGINPKNLALTVAGAGTIAQAGLSAGDDVIAIAVFVLVASVSVALPVGAYLALGDKARAPLATVQSWMGQNNATIMMVVCIVLAAKLLGAGVTGILD